MCGKQPSRTDYLRPVWIQSAFLASMEEGYGHLLSLADIMRDYEFRPISCCFGLQIAQFAGRGKTILCLGELGRTWTPVGDVPEAQQLVTRTCLRLSFLKNTQPDGMERTVRACAVDDRLTQPRGAVHPLSG